MAKTYDNVVKMQDRMKKKLGSNATLQTYLQMKRDVFFSLFLKLSDYVTQEQLDEAVEEALKENGL